MNVASDMSKCRGYASCVLEAPTVFDVDEEENVVVVLQESPPEDLRRQVERAVHCCPTRAIAIVDE